MMPTARATWNSQSLIILRKGCLQLLSHDPPLQDILEALRETPRQQVTMDGQVLPVGAVTQLVHDLDHPKGVALIDDHELPHDLVHLGAELLELVDLPA